jgi:hypothetical protein
MKQKHPTCAWPRCGARVTSSDFLPLVGENTGRVYACSAHRDRISLTKAVVGTGLLAAFREGMDRALPGVREKIGTTGAAVLDLVNDVRAANAKGRQPAE